MPVAAPLKDQSTSLSVASRIKDESASVATSCKILKHVSGGSYQIKACQWRIVSKIKARQWRLVANIKACQ